MPRVLTVSIMTALVMILITSQAGAADRPTVKVEFRWAENEPIPGLTEDKGIRLSCGKELTYLHKAPILTNQDVAKAQLKYTDLRRNGLGELYSIDLHLTDNAIQKLAMAKVGNRKLLVVVVDGRPLSAWMCDKSKLAEFVPRAGFLSKKAEAERIVDAFR